MEFQNFLLHFQQLERSRKLTSEKTILPLKKIELYAWIFVNIQYIHFVSSAKL